MFDTDVDYHIPDPICIPNQPAPKEFQQGHMRQQVTSIIDHMRESFKSALRRHHPSSDGSYMGVVVNKSYQLEYRFEWSLKGIHSVDLEVNLESRFMFSFRKISSSGDVSNERTPIMNEGRTK